MRRIAALIALLAAPFVTGPAAANDTPLERLSTGDAMRAWEGVGRLDVGGESFCSAALVAPDLILTAAHCIFSHDGRRVPLGGIRFLAGWRDGRASAYRGVKDAVIHPSYAHGAEAATESVPSDVALLRLDAPIRSSSIPPFEVGPLPRGAAKLGVVSYAAGRAEAPSLQRSCELLATRGAMLVTSCEADFGASGAPIFDFSGARPRIVSVVSAKAKSGGHPVALGAAAAAALPELQAMLTGPRSVFAQAPQGAAVRRLDADGKAAVGAKFLRP